MRREYLVVRHPKPKLKDDWFMLDRWTPAVTHVVTNRYHEVPQPNGARLRIYRGFCSCGWRTPRAQSFPIGAEDLHCPVGQALQARAESLSATDGYLKWCEDTAPGAGPPSTDKPTACEP